MGRIKSAPVKRMSVQLIRYHKEKFSENFNENKIVTDLLVDTGSKKVRNTIAGYVTRMVKEGQDVSRR